MKENKNVWIRGIIEEIPFLKESGSLKRIVLEFFKASQ